MRHHARALFPPEFHTNPAHFQALGLAAVYTVLLLSQLFTFEDFRGVTNGFGLPGGGITASVLAFALPVVQAMALPYLLSMKLSRRLHAVSRACTLLAPALWLAIALWTNLSGNNLTSLGIFGATLYTPNEWWSILMLALMSWAAWLMYVATPLHMRHSR
jgi:hypothetical protein